MSWQRTLGGAASGAAAGSAFGPVGSIIGGGLGILGGLFGGDDGEQDFRRQQQLYQQLLSQYQGPESDPKYQQMMGGLEQASQGGFTNEDKAALLQGYQGAADMARGREGAIAQQQLMRGGGVAQGGAMGAMQQQASQAAAQRYQMAGTQQAGIAANRGMQARLAYLDQVQRNKQSLNNYRMQATGMLGNSYGNMANYHGAKDAANQEALSSGADAVGQAGMYYQNQQRQDEYMKRRQMQDMYSRGSPENYMPQGQMYG